jgi:hypothetical protein
VRTSKAKGVLSATGYVLRIELGSGNDVLLGRQLDQHAKHKPNNNLGDATTTTGDERGAPSSHG